MKGEINLYVYGVFPDGETVQVGRILSRNLNQPGRFQGFFKYSLAFLAHLAAYPVDPVHLPLSNKVFEAINGETGIHDVFEDSLPDAWGRHILARKGGLEHAGYTPAHLLGVLHGGGLGRLLFSEKEEQPVFKDGSIAFADIAVAMEEAAKLERSVDTDNAEIRHLLACGSSAGGARPKVLTARDDKLWIAKFASTRDIHPELFVALEEAGMKLALRAGLDVPEISKEKVGKRAVLFVRRFDLTLEHGRNALVSFRTLLGITDHYAVSYADLAAVIRRFSFQPGRDVELLYRQMLVNILLVNTDDHLQNFAMIHTSDGWRLSPAYDIAPNIYQTGQILQVHGKHSGIGREDLIAEGKGFGLSVQTAKQLIGETVASLSGWQDVFEECSVVEEHTGRLREMIGERLAALG